MKNIIKLIVFISTSLISSNNLKAMENPEYQLSQSDNLIHELIEICDEHLDEESRNIMHQILIEYNLVFLENFKKIFNKHKIDNKSYKNLIMDEIENVISLKQYGQFNNKNEPTFLSEFRKSTSKIRYLTKKHDEELLAVINEIQTK